jgi:hypothetical protein
MSQYAAASIEATVKVEAFSPREQDYPARRTIELSFHERFASDADLDKAIDSFAATIREAARR